MPTPLERYVAPVSVDHRPSWINHWGFATALVLLGLIIAAAASFLFALPPSPARLALTAILLLLFWGALLRNGRWRFTVGLGLILLGWLVWGIALMIVFVLWQILVAGLPVPEALDSLNRLLTASTPGAVIFKLASFAGIWPATWAVVRLLHSQRFGTLFSPEARVRWRDFFGGLLLAVAFSAGTLGVALVAVGLPARTELPLETWLIALAPLAILIFLQASGEELIFRGYLLQQLAARFRTPLIWGGAPAILFGLAHVSAQSEELGISPHYVVVTAVFGFAAAALVWRTGSLAAAMGLHTGMNLFAISGLGVKGVLEGSQLYIYPESLAGELFTIDGIATGLILLFVLSPLCPFGPRAVPARGEALADPGMPRG